MARMRLRRFSEHLGLPSPGLQQEDGPPSPRSPFCHVSLRKTSAGRPVVLAAVVMATLGDDDDDDLARLAGSPRHVANRPVGAAFDARAMSPTLRAVHPKARRSLDVDVPLDGDHMFGRGSPNPFQPIRGGSDLGHDDAYSMAGLTNVQDLRNAAIMHQGYDPEPMIKACVKVFVTQVQPSYAMPWARGEEARSTGSGFVVEMPPNELFMTCACTHLASRNALSRVLARLLLLLLLLFCPISLELHHSRAPRPSPIARAGRWAAAATWPTLQRRRRWSSARRIQTRRRRRQAGDAS